MHPLNDWRWPSGTTCFEMTLVAASPVDPSWLLWQLADSAFPGGAFAHSLGLEAAWQHGEVRHREELAAYVNASLRQAGSSLVPFFNATRCRPEALVEVDHRAEAWLTNPMANRASRLQGRALHSAAARIFRMTLEPSPFRHWAPVFGILLHRLDVPLEEGVRLVLFLHPRGLLSAAVRLGIMGPLEAQALQFDSIQLLQQLATDSVGRTLDQVAQTSPLHDLWQGSHDRLESRLFQS